MDFPTLLTNSMRSIRRNKTRSGLTMLGIIIGIGSVIVMVALGKGTEMQIQNQIQSLGVNLLTVFPGSFRQGSVNTGAGTMSRLTEQDAEALKRDGRIISAVSPVVRVNAQTVGPLGNWNTSVFGVSPDFIDIRQWEIAEGSVFTDQEVRGSAKVCILGATVAQNLFGSESPTGETIRIKNSIFKISGVLAAKGFAGSGVDQDDVILAPHTTVTDRLSRNRFLGQILVSAVSSDRMGEAQNEIQTILRETHRISEGADDDFSVRNQADVIETASQTMKMLTIFLASIAAISLAVGGIGIMNIMLVSVSERTREIGIRMAVGARERDIMRQFLFEALTLCAIGGIAGIGFGYSIALLIEKLAKWPVIFSIYTVLVATGVSCVIGIFFGYYPAKRAAALNPIDALRYE